MNNMIQTIFGILCYSVTYIELAMNVITSLGAMTSLTALASFAGPVIVSISCVYSLLSQRQSTGISGKQYSSV